MSLQKFTSVYSICLAMCIVTVLFGYRQLVEIPKLKQEISSFQQRELSTLYLTLQREQDYLATINYDYAVWDDSYRYITQHDPKFINTNFVDDTFISLKIDGALYIDEKFNVVWHKGYDSSKKYSLDFDWVNLLASLNMQQLYPTGQQLLASKTGFIRTKQGAVMFSATQIRNSDKSGENVGILVFVKKIRPSLVSLLAKFTQLKLELTLIDQAEQAEQAALIPQLKGQLQGDPFGFTRQRILVDINQQPLLLLSITHLTSASPPLVDSKFIMTLLLIMLIPLAMHLLVTAYLVSPVNIGAKKIEQMLDTSRLESLPEDIAIKELRILFNGFNQLISTINKQQEQLKKQSLTDSLTGIANRRAFDVALQKSWARSQRSNTEIAIVLLDIDYFKKYNDTQGHLAGDEALKQVAKALSSQLKRVDDLVARYGGEEFVVILTNTDKKRVAQVMAQLTNSIEKLKIPNPGSTVSQYLTISSGAAIYQDFSLAPVKYSVKMLLEQADKALYQAKSQGRNVGVFYK